MTSLLGAHVGGPKRVLDSSERIAEVLFGLIMVLTFTGSLSATEAGREGVRAMLIGALGCNIAWGIIVGVLYLMSAVGERGSNLTVFRAVRGARDAAHARRLISADSIGCINDGLERLRLVPRLVCSSSCSSPRSP